MNFEWLLAPERLLTFFLFFLALFRTEIRAALDKSVIFSGSVFRGVRALRSQKELNDLMRIHGNVYELVLYLAFEIVSAIVWSLWAIVIVTIVLYALVPMGYLIAAQVSSTPIVAPLIVAMSISKLREVWRVLSGLYQYEYRVKRLKQVIELASSPKDK